MKKYIFFLSVVVLLGIFSASCQAPKASKYDSLSTYNKSIVDTVLEHKNEFANCNQVKFGKNYSEIFFIASKMEITSDLGPFGGAGRYTETHYYIVGNKVFRETNKSVGGASNGIFSPWNSKSDENTLREILSGALQAALESHGDSNMIFS